MSKTEKPDDTPVEAVEEPVPETVEAVEEPVPETAEAVEEPLPETEEQPAPKAQEVAQPEARKGGGGIAWLALFVAVLGAAAAVYLAWNKWQDRGTAADDARIIADLRATVSSTQQAVTSLQQQLEEMSGLESSVSSQLGALQRDVDERVRLLDSLPSRTSSLEQSLASLQGLSAGARDTLLLAEAEYYMQIANAQLQLAGNPELASMALSMADDRIVQIADPALTDVRRALSDELAALEIMEQPDIAGITLTLASLSRVVESLPLRQEASEAEDDAEDGDAEMSRLDRAWTSVKGAFSGLVKVNKTADGARPLLAPEAIYFLRTNLSLQLQAARLALLRGEKTVYEQSLDDASNWIDEYFDTESQQVQSTRETIAEVREGTFTASVPDISESLRLLRQYQTLKEPAQ